MPDKEKKSDFVVTDRRLFSTDGELRQDVVEDEERRAEREREKREAQQRVNDERAERNQPAPPASTQTMAPPRRTGAGGAHRSRATGLCRRLQQVGPTNGRPDQQGNAQAGADASARPISR